MLLDQVLLQRAQQYLAETLPAAQLGLNEICLADGLPVVDQSMVIAIVSLRFGQKIPDMLKDRLVLANVKVSWHQTPYDPQHWMGSEQPTQLPVITIEAIFSNYQKQRILLRESIELLLD